MCYKRELERNHLNLPVTAMALCLFLLLSSCSLPVALLAKEHAPCSGGAGATCNAKQALVEDLVDTSGIAVELFQKKSSFMNPDKSEAKEVPDKDAVQVDKQEAKIRSVIEVVDKAGKADAQIKGQKQDAPSDYTMKSVEKKMQDSAKQSSNEEAQGKTPVSYFKLLARGKWCDKMGSGKKSLHGIAADGHTMSSCQGACNRDGSCRYFTFDSQKHWCTTWLDCGELTESPHAPGESNEGFVVYKRVDEFTHVYEVAGQLKDIAEHHLDKEFEDKVQSAKAELEDAKAVEKDFEDELQESKSEQKVLKSTKKALDEALDELHEVVDATFKSEKMEKALKDPLEEPLNDETGE